MSYSDFTIPSLKKQFQLTIEENTNLFAGIPEEELPATLANLLHRYLPLALNLNTEKARSELVISPMLTELKLHYPDQISLFSGLEFNVDETVGLKGRCDYILSRSPEQLALTAPVCVLVEAKNENIVGGIAQCLAEMVAGLRFNEANGLVLPWIYGVVTTGILWRFLKLAGQQAYVDSVEYSIQTPKQIFGILKHITLSHEV